MTDHPANALDVRQDRHLIRPGAHSKRFVVATVTVIMTAIATMIMTGTNH